MNLSVPEQHEEKALAGDFECVEGAFLETAFTQDQVERANVVEASQSQNVLCFFMGATTEEAT